MKTINQIIDDGCNAIDKELNVVDTLVGGTHEELKQALFSILRKSIKQAATCGFDCEKVSRYCKEKLEEDFDQAPEAQAFEIATLTKEMGFIDLAEKMFKQL